MMQRTAAVVGVLVALAVSITTSTTCWAFATPAPVTQSCTDGVYCQESAGTEPVVLKGVTVTGAAFQVNGGHTRADDWDSSRYSTNAGFVPQLGKNVLDLLAPMSGERILDVGCGDGVLTAELQGKCHRVVGIDFAPDMVKAAVERGVEAYVMDASSIDAPFLFSKIAEHDGSHASSNDKQTTTITAPAHEGTADSRGDQACAGLSYGESAAYDAVFTNAALHWLKSPRSAIEGVRRVLRPGGRFVGEFGGHGNIAGVRIAMHAAISRRGVDPREIDPWFFPTPEEFRLLLEAAGFVVDDIALIPRPTVLPRVTGMRGWLSTFARAFINALPVDASGDVVALGPKEELSYFKATCDVISRSHEQRIHFVEVASELDDNGLTKAQAEVIDEVLAALQPALRDNSGLWTVDYVRLRFRVHVPLAQCNGKD